jgi:hypothetical protein
VTDHSSPAPLRVRLSGRVHSLYLRLTGGTLLQAALWAQRGLLVCRFCGRRGQFLSGD